MFLLIQLSFSCFFLCGTFEIGILSSLPIRLLFVLCEVLLLAIDSFLLVKYNCQLNNPFGFYVSLKYSLYVLNS